MIWRKAALPTFERFERFRIEIRSRDHAPPHFRVVGPDFQAMIEIRTLRVLRGALDRKVLAEVTAWASARTDALMSEWRRLNERD